MTPETPTPSEGPGMVDYRFILANERTFLAWMRTALGIIAGGVALNEFVRIENATAVVAALSIVIIALGAIVAIIGTLFWARTDAAMYEGRPMRRTRILIVMGIGVTLIAAAVALLIALT